MNYKLDFLVLSTEIFKNHDLCYDSSAANSIGADTAALSLFYFTLVMCRFAYFYHEYPKSTCTLNFE